jgi:hypothetical protein
MKLLTPEDFVQFQNSNRSVELIQRQYEFLIHGTSVQHEIEAAKLGNGIQKLSLEEEKEALDVFHKERGNLSMMKFVPASGAASRMFAPFFSFLEARKAKDFNFEEYRKTKEGSGIDKLFKELKKIPFYAAAYAKILEDNTLPLNTDLDFFIAFASVVLDSKGLNLPNLPKALIPFFVDEKGQQWTPFEAQLFEGFQLGDQHQAIPIHLTIDNGSRALFESAESQFRLKLPPQQSKNFKVEYSYQHPLTDTPFLGKKNEWVRNEEGKIAFRKGGHGALLENLNQLEEDVIWIKNIDNILLNQENENGEKWMQILAGHLRTVQKKSFTHLTDLEKNKSEANFDQIISFIQTYFDPDYKFVQSDKLPNERLYDYLYRPLRICGMIPNKGAKGGGPFWIKNARGKSLQIMEEVELDVQNEGHKKALSESTHFNPVMMVCGIKDHNGKKFSLYEFRDEKRFMVSEKNWGASKIKILEWPGLWNGGMAAWNTVFIHLPSDTFHPVKTIADLIR